MARRNYAIILNHLQGLNPDELILLRNRIDSMLASPTLYTGSIFKKPDTRHVEVKRIQNKRKDGSYSPAHYAKYYRWYEDGRYKSEYIGAASESEYIAYTNRPKAKRTRKAA